MVEKCSGECFHEGPEYRPVDVRLSRHRQVFDVSALANHAGLSDRRFLRFLRFLRILVTGFAERRGDNNYGSCREDYCSDSDGDAIAEECCQQSCEQGAE